MEELVHKDCGGELDITWVYNDGHGAKEVEFTCLECGKVFSYMENFD